MWKKYENGVFLANHVLPTFSSPGVLDATLQASYCDLNIKKLEKRFQIIMMKMLSEERRNFKELSCWREYSRKKRIEPKSHFKKT